MLFPNVPQDLKFIAVVLVWDITFWIKHHIRKIKTPPVTTLLCCYSHGICSACFGLYYKTIIMHYEILQESWFCPVQWLYHNTQL